MKATIKHKKFNKHVLVRAMYSFLYYKTSEKFGLIQ